MTKEPDRMSAAELDRLYRASGRSTRELDLLLNEECPGIACGATLRQWRQGKRKSGGVPVAKVRYVRQMFAKLGVR